MKGWREHGFSGGSWLHWNFCNFFYIKVLEVLTIVSPIENPKKKLQLKVMNSIHIPIRYFPH